MFDLVNIFEVFLPQLLRYPNASDPLNSDAASLLLDNEENYNCKVREYVQKYASAEQQQDREDSDQKEASETSSSSSGRGFEQQLLQHPQGTGDRMEEEEEDEDDFDDGASEVSEMSDL